MRTDCGISSVLAAGANCGGGEGGEMGGTFAADSSLMKTVRVVTTVEYYLEK